VHSVGLLQGFRADVMRWLVVLRYEPPDVIRQSGTGGELGAERGVVSQHVYGLAACSEAGQEVGRERFQEGHDDAMAGVGGREALADVVQQSGQEEIAVRAVAPFFQGGGYGQALDLVGGGHAVE
jgi:hypothetical protein